VDICVHTHAVSLGSAGRWTESPDLESYVSSPSPETPAPWSYGWNLQARSTVNTSHQHNRQLSHQWSFRLGERKHPKHTFYCLFIPFIYLHPHISLTIYINKLTFSPLQWHVHTPKFRVLFTSIFWRFLLRGLFIYHSKTFLYHFIPKTKQKMCFFLSVDCFLIYGVIKRVIKKPFYKNL